MFFLLLIFTLCAELFSLVYLICLLLFLLSFSGLKEKNNWDVFLCLLLVLSRFQIVHVVFKPFSAEFSIWYELMFQVHSSACGHPVFPTSTTEQTVRSHLLSSNLSRLYALYCVLFVHVFVFMSYWLGILVVWYLQLCSFYSRLLWLSSLLWFYINLSIIFSISVKKVIDIFLGITRNLKSTLSSVGICNNIDSSNP